MQELQPQKTIYKGLKLSQLQCRILFQLQIESGALLWKYLEYKPKKKNHNTLKIAQKKQYEISIYSGLKNKAFPQLLFVKVTSDLNKLPYP